MSMIGGYCRLDEAKLGQLLGEPEALEEFLFTENDSLERLDIDKTWHVIHFLLNGDPWAGEGPLGKVVLGGTECTADLGYGPARFLAPADVRAAAAALAGITAEDLLARFDAEAVKRAEIYPVDAWSGSAEDREYIGDNFNKLKAFFAQAGKAGQAVVLYLS